MSKTVAGLRTLFESLFREQDLIWNPNRSRKDRSPPSSAARVQEYLIIEHPPIEERDFEQWFPRSAKELFIDFSTRHKVLYLPPLEKNSNFVPILSLECKLSDTWEFIRLRIMLFSLDEAEENDKGNLRGIGFRLESPSKSEFEDSDEEDDGRHDFYHAQFIRSLNGGRDFDCPSWLPCTQPSFPLTAKCPITLVISMLLSLYGKNLCWEFYDRYDYKVKALVRPYFTELQPWIGWEALDGV